MAENKTPYTIRDTLQPPPMLSAETRRVMDALGVLETALAGLTADAQHRLREFCVEALRTRERGW